MLDTKKYSEKHSVFLPLDIHKNSQAIEVKCYHTATFFIVVSKLNMGQFQFNLIGCNFTTSIYQKHSTDHRLIQTGLSGAPQKCNQSQQEDIFPKHCRF